MTRRILGTVVLALACARAGLAQPVIRSDWTVPGGAGLQLFVREVVPRAGADAAVPPVLLLHDAYVPSVASFDLPAANGSLAADLASAGLRVYLVDLRGYGRSTRPPRMGEPPVPGVPLLRSSEAIEDVDAAVTWVLTRTGAVRVSVLGWGIGGHWAGLYATRYPARVASLVLYNTLYGGGSNHPRFGRGSDLDDRTKPGTLVRTIGAYRFHDGARLMRDWDGGVPAAGRGAWRDPAVAAAFVKEALASDPTSSSRTPPSIRSPSGPLADIFELATGRQTWDAGLVQCRALVIAGERDTWSRPEDRDRLKAHLVNASEVQVIAIPEATHYLHLDRPDRGRTAFVRAVNAFLARPPATR